METASKPKDKSGFVDNWQGGKSLAECNLHMLKTRNASDVMFRCGRFGIEVWAHRYVLISRSCVFHAMFAGPLAEKDGISVPEVKLDVFKQFLIYVYTDNTKIDADNVTGLLYLARKYAVTELERLCEDFLYTYLNIDNACVILDAALSFDQNQLFQSTLAFIKRNGEKSLQSSGFLTVSQESVRQIVASDDLVVDEHVVFTAINSWAEAECERQEREITPEAKRSVLGDDILMKVRFPLMKQSFLEREVKCSGLLTESEMSMVSMSSTTNVKPFNSAERKQTRQSPGIFIKRGARSSPRSPVPSTLVSVNRFQEKGYSWSPSAKRTRRDAVSFKGNRDLLICGYQLYGPYSNAKTTYKVTTSFRGDNTAVLQHKTIHVTSSDVFDVVFPNPVLVSAGQWYTLSVSVGGAHSWRGEGGTSSVVCEDGVGFKFRTPSNSDVGDCVSEGLIPSLIYHVP